MSTVKYGAGVSCPAKKIQQIIKAVKKIHPWEQVDIEFIRLEE